MHLPAAPLLTGVFRLILYWKRILISGSSSIGNRPSFQADLVLDNSAGSGRGEKSGMMLVAEPVQRHRPRNSAYRWPLRVQTINAVSRPINFSRITNSRIINGPPFCSAWRPGLEPGFLVLKLKCFAREPAHPRFTERLLM